MKQEAKKIRILLIEDNPDDVLYIQELLDDEEYHNYDFEYSEYLKEGIANLKEKQFDVVLLDLSLPDSQGLATVERLISLFPDLPIVVLTGLKDDALGVESIKTGAQDYQVKGKIDADSLVHSILYAIERHSLLVKSRFSNRFLKSNLSYFKHLINFSHRINKKLSLISIFKVLKEKVESLCFCRLFSLFLLDAERQQLQLVSHNHPEWEHLLDAYFVGQDNGIMWNAIQQRNILRIDNFSASDYQRGPEKRYQSEMAICIPLIFDNVIIGVLNLNDPVLEEFSDDIMVKMETVCLQLSMAINNAMLHKKIEELSITDSLTGLFNRRHLSIQLINEIKRVRDVSLPLSILMLDIDSFKQVNDTYGHLAGDRVLHEVASLIKSTIRKIDTPGRYGGEEFIVIMPNIGGEEAVERAELIRRALENRSIQLDDERRIAVTLSIGVAEYSPAMVDENMLIKNADTALYKAKHRGKNQVILYSAELESTDNRGFVVRVFFIQPFMLISGVIDSLVKMEFESYPIRRDDKWKLLKILDPAIRNILFICINNDGEVEDWLAYVKELEKQQSLDIRIGAFIFNQMEMDTRLLFLERNISTIQLGDVQHNTISLIERILACYEARAGRKHIRARAVDNSRAFFSVNFQDIPVKGSLLNISIYSFACRVETDHIDCFKVGSYFEDVLLILKGQQIRIASRVLGFHKDDHQICFFQIYNRGPRNQNAHVQPALDPPVSDQLYGVISFCLKEDLRLKLEGCAG